jgi:uncharacterized protein YbjT (DUF2867 family)
VIAVPGLPDPAAGRLLAALARRGGEASVRVAALPADGSPVTLALSAGPGADVAGLRAALGARPVRVLVLSRLGAHPDARHPALAALWRLEEAARACGWPVLTLRFAPLVGPGAPFWNRLRTNPALPGGGRKLLNPALEADAIETLVRALDGRAAWDGWYEVAGPEVWRLAELRELAAAAGPGQDAGAWEPPLAELAEHKLAESQPWRAHFGIVPAPIAEGVRERAA